MKNNKLMQKRMKKETAYIIILIGIIFLFLIPTHKTYSKYKKEEIITVAEISIDKTPPEIEVEYSSKEITKNKITVTIISNEEIKKLENWVEIEKGKVYQKTYDSNQKTEINIFDIYDNKKTITIEIDNIDKINPVINGVENNGWYNTERKITYTDNKKIKKAQYYYNSEKLEFAGNATTFESGKIFSQEGYYKIRIEDEAGNMTEKIFIIEKQIPEIKLIDSVTNNTKYPNTVNRNGTVTAKIEFKDQNYLKNNLLAKNIQIKVGDKLIGNYNLKINILEENQIGGKAELVFSNITENGILGIKLAANTIVDKAGNGNKEIEFETPIIIDNTAPTATFKEKVIQDGRVFIQIIANEQMREKDGWSLLSNQEKIEKEFPCNTEYEVPICDLAGNESRIPIKVTKATEIIFNYRVHSSVWGWLDEKESCQIAGQEAMNEDSKYKIESLLFSVQGKQDKDFVRFRTYIHHHWAESGKGICRNTGQVYSYGYNPGATTWKTMKDSLVEKDGKQYIQFGGAGINEGGYRDYEGNNPLPEEIAIQCLYRNFRN